MMVAGLALHITPTDRILRVMLREGKNVPERSLSRAGNNQTFSTSGLRMTIFLFQDRAWRNQISRRQSFP